MDKSFDHIDQLAYRINPDGSVDLEQDLGAGNVERVFLHRLHVRLLLEETGHLLPPQPPDELAKRLARQLCELRLELANEYGRSPSLNEAITMLGAFCDSLPDSVFPFELYPDDSPELATRNTDPDRPDFQLTHSPKEQKQ